MYEIIDMNSPAVTGYGDQLLLITLKDFTIF